MAARPMPSIPRPPFLGRVDAALRGGEVLAHAVRFIAAKRYWRLAGRDFLRRAPRVFTLGQAAKYALAVPREGFDPQPGLQSARSAAICAQIAERKGLPDEAGALWITHAWLLFTIFDAEVMLGAVERPVDETNEEFLRAFLALSRLERLPEDDSDFWRDRLAQIVAALLPYVGAFDHTPALQATVREALVRVGRMVSVLAPHESLGTVTPRQLAHYYEGPAYVHRALIRLELLAGLPKAAGRRALAVLEGRFEDRGDEFHTLLLGMAAHRQLDDAATYAALQQRLASTVNDARLEFRSFEGRLFAMQHVVHDLLWATMTWSSGNGLGAEEVFAIAELTKARALLDDVAGHGGPPAILAVRSGAPASAAPEDPPAAQEFEDAVDPDLWGEMHRASIFVASTGSAISAFSPCGPFHESYLAEYQQHLSRDAARARVGGAYAGAAVPATLQAVQAALLPHELFIAYYSPRDPFQPGRDVCIAVVSKDRIGLSSLYFASPGVIQRMSEDPGTFVERGPMTDLVADLRARILHGDDDEETIAKLKALHRHLIAPVAELGFTTQEFGRWIMAPTGALHQLPFGALVDDHGEHLVQQVGLTIVPSASVWLRMRRAPLQHPPRALVVGDPRLGHAHAAPPLESARAEARDVARALDARTSTIVLTEADANLAAVVARLASSNIVHFAAHGEFDPANPRFGQSVLLGPGPLDDGALDAGRLRHLPLQELRMLVLNICNGASCRYGPGDEPLGLLAAAVAAGVENIVGLLWALSDRATAAFASDLHRCLLDTGFDPAAAMQSAAKMAIARGRPLRDWAGYVLVGPGRPFAERAR